MITRRGMLKGSMGAAVGTVYGGTLISFLTGCGSDNDSDEKVEVLPGGLMVVNPVICVSCRRCEIACGWNHEAIAAQPGKGQSRTQHELWASWCAV